MVTQRGYLRAKRRLWRLRSGTPICGWVSNPLEFSLSMTQRKHRQTAVLSFGDPAGIRTPDTLLKRQVLCLLS